jgi:hypothetical protein
LDMNREWKEIEFPEEYCICIWNQQDHEVDQEIDGKMKCVTNINMVKFN